MRRFFAFSIDIILVSLVIFYIIAAFFSMEATENTTADFLCFAAFILYNFIFDFFFDGRSIGKRLLRIKVVFLSEDRKKLYLLTHGLFRYLTASLNLFFGIYYIFKHRLPQDDLFHTVTEKL